MIDASTFSFVMPAYKAGFIRESIDSILAQTVDDFELIVVDDCSPEPIADIVKAYNDVRLTYYRNEENIGGTDLVAQWNKCLSYAKGEWVILATDDDVYEPTFLETFNTMLTGHSDVDLFRGRICRIDAKGRITNIEKCYERYLSPVHFFYEMMNGMTGGIPQYIFKRKKLVQNGGFVSFPKAWGSDDATSIMMSCNGVMISEKPLVSFRWSGQNISTVDKYGEDKVNARIAYSKWMLKHQPKQSSGGRIEAFYYEEIGKRLLTMLKVNLITTMRFLPFNKRVILMASWLKQLDLFGTRDKLSIVLRILL